MANAGKAKLNVLHLSTADIQGGAARAAYRLHQGLVKQGVNSAMLVQEKTSTDARVFAPNKRSQQILTSTRVIWDTLPLKFYPGFQQDGAFYPQWLPERVAGQISKLQPDILNLHWLSGGFIRLESLAKFQQPMVWTLHDMWAFTGGCHYSGNCQRYQQTCGHCPQLGSTQTQDLSHWVWQRKKKAWQGLNLTIVCPTQWLADAARSSALFAQTRIEVIANGLDLETYRPIDSGLARQLLKLPADRPLVMFGALQATSDPRKGFDLLQTALLHLRASVSQSTPLADLEIVVFGATQPADPPNLGFPVHYLGQLQDELTLALVYSAADLMVVPSRQENLAQTACEALACGTPVVTFGQTGLADVVDHQRNGYLAQLGDAQSLAAGIAWVLAEPERLAQLSGQARQSAEQRLGLVQMVQAYQILYGNILAGLSADPAMN